MSCTRGCCDSALEHYRSVNGVTHKAAKRTVDDTETAVVTTTEHWDDHVDVKVQPRVVSASFSLRNEAGEG